MIVVKQPVNSSEYVFDKSVKVNVEARLNELIQALKDQADETLIRYCKGKLEHLSLEKTNDKGECKSAEINSSSHNERIDTLMQLVVKHPSDTLLQKILGKKRVARSVMITIIGVLMISIGFTMIVLPAPHDFEIYTIYYFNPNDGFTLMDLFSLMIVFGGVFVLLNNVRKSK